MIPTNASQHGFESHNNKYVYVSIRCTNTVVNHSFSDIKTKNAIVCEFENLLSNSRNDDVTSSDIHYVSVCNKVSLFDLWHNRLRHL